MKSIYAIGNQRVSQLPLIGNQKERIQGCEQQNFNWSFYEFNVILIRLNNVEIIYNKIIQYFRGFPIQFILRLKGGSPMKTSKKAQEKKLPSSADLASEAEPNEGELLQGFEATVSGGHPMPPEMEEKLMQIGVTVDEQFWEKGHLQLSWQSEMSTVADLHVGCYRMSISIMRIFAKTWSELAESDQRFNVLGIGSFGKVMRIAIQNSEYACKHIKISKNLSEELYFILREFMIAKIAGALGVGPRIQDKLGYDVILFDNEAVFLMDKTLEINYLANWIQPYPRNFQQQLTQSLNILHTLNIIHGDIKPDNIMWDPTRKKFIFVDFGFSKILKSKEPTLCSFFGTISYCCPEMAKQYLLKTKGLVDLEQNDRWGLRQTIQKTLKSSKDASLPSTLPYFQFTKNQPSSGFQSENSLVALLRFYFNIFLGDTAKVLRTVKKEPLRENYHCSTEKYSGATCH